MADPGAAPTAPPDPGPEPQGYAAATEELEAILAEIEDDAVDVDRLTERVARAALLIRWCRARSSPPSLTATGWTSATIGCGSTSSTPSEPRTAGRGPVAMSFDDDEKVRLRSRFEELRATGDPAIRDELIEAHLRLAQYLARRFDNRGVPLEDLLQVAALGLVKAVERFDPDRGLEFSTFATPTIVGELKRHFRDKGWSVRVPRRIQELHVELNGHVGRLTQTLGRSPTIVELAHAAGTSTEEVLEAMDAAQAYRSASLDRRLPSEEGDAGGLGDLVGSEEPGLRQVEDAMVAEGLIASLPKREQLMVRMRFYDGMTQSQIAERLGISQMHVSRLLTRSLALLRAELEDG